ncbi:MAG: flagellar motor switch protein FliM, partial [Serratia symbiotica]|nr:flagellar motor switch protein FliM [Serratia symbiotica]
MNDTVLSQAERDALLNGDDEKDTQAAVTDEGNEIKPYDPTTQRRMVR